MKMNILCLSTMMLITLTARSQVARIDVPEPAKKAEAKPLVTYLGIQPAPPTPALRKQLGLAAGQGLTVAAVAPESPAAVAGVEQFDVLAKLDDQILINPEQFIVLIRAKKKGEKVSLSLIRGGKPMVLTCTLEQNEDPGTPLFGTFPFTIKMDRTGTSGTVTLHAPDADHDELRKVWVRFLLRTSNKGDADMDELVELAKPGKKGKGGKKNKKKAHRFADDEHDITVTVEDDVKRVRVTDAKGKLIIDKELRTMEDYEALPENIRWKMEQMGKKHPGKKKGEEQGFGL